MWRQQLMSIVYFACMCVALLYFSDATRSTSGLQKAQAVNADVTLDSYESRIAESITVLSPKRFGFNRVGGLEAIKADLRWLLVLPLQNPSMYDNANLCPPNAFLFDGAPGTGKTMLAQAVAAEAGVALVSLKMTSIEDKYVGESAKSLRAAFTLCAKLKRVVLFIDEIDGAFGRSRNVIDSQHDYGLKTTMLQLFDEFPKVPVICATNHVSVLDPALVRRFGRQFTFPKPDEPGRRQILEKLLHGESIVQIPSKVPRATDGWTPAGLKRLVETARSNRNRRLFAAHPKRLSYFLANPRTLPRIKSSDWVMD